MSALRIFRRRLASALACSNCADLARQLAAAERHIPDLARQLAAAKEHVRLLEQANAGLAAKVTKLEARRRSERTS